MDSSRPSSFDSIAALDEFMTAPSEGVIEALRQCPGSVAVLGAAGKMGFHVSRMLQRANEQLGRKDPIITVSRFGSDSSRRQFEGAGFNVIAADLSDPDQVASLPRADNVFFLAGMKFGTSQDPALLQRMNVTMPKLVANHYASSRVVALSTGCVYSFTAPESGGSDEQSDTDPPGDYARSCLGREAAFRDSGVSCALIRLNYAIDLRYGVLVDVAQAVREDRPVSVDTGYVNVIWQGDAVTHTIQALPHTSAPPFVINVTGPSVLKVRDLAQAFAQRFGKEARIEGEEAPTAWLSNASLSHDLFGPPQVPLEQMIDWVAHWLEAEGEILNKPTHFENRDGNY